MKHLHILLIFLSGISLQASELRVEDEPEETKSANMALPGTIVTKRQTYYRGEKKIGAIIDWTLNLQGQPSQTSRFVQFFVASDTWVEASLKAPKAITTKSNVPIIVVAVEDSITVSASSIGYYEVFFLKDTMKFLDGDARTAVLRSGPPYDFNHVEHR